MTQIKFAGNPVHIKGDMPTVGQQAEDFTFVKQDLSEASLYDFEGIKVLMPLPSLDTGICQMETRRFNQDIGGMEGVTGIVISKDLPFAMKRFCAAEGIENIVTASDFRYNDFANEYHLEMADGPMKGIIARAILVLDNDNKIAYTELVDDITHEPNYDAALDAVKALQG